MPDTGTAPAADPKSNQQPPGNAPQDPPVKDPKTAVQTDPSTDTPDDGGFGFSGPVGGDH